MNCERSGLSCSRTPDVVESVLIPESGFVSGKRLWLLRVTLAPGMTLAVDWTLGTAELHMSPRRWVRAEETPRAAPAHADARLEWPGIFLSPRKLSCSHRTPGLQSAVSPGSVRVPCGHQKAVALLAEIRG